MHLILLWFGSYKTAKSTYVPGWMKKDVTRFPRVRILNDTHQLTTVDLLSPFNQKAWDADAKAFSTLMRHLRHVDEKDSTVLMVQVENEPGLLGDSRDRSFLAERAFKEPVSSDLLAYLPGEEVLHSQFQRRWPNFHTDSSNHNKQHSWEGLFRHGTATDELFMADAFARYVAHVASAGKEAYNLPLYTNTWLNFEDPAFLGDERSLSVFGAGGEGIPVAAGGSKVGEYPSGGPVPHVLDIWLYHTRNILAFISPDLYLQDYEWTTR
jgi:beta-galactosidase GanA